VASNEREARVTSNDRRPRAVTIVPVRAATADLTKVALTDLEVASTAPVAADPVIWIARPRTGRVVTFRASVSKAFKAADLIDPVAAEDSAVIALVEEDSVAAVIALVAAALAGLAGSAAVAGSEADDEN
jgi:hypothetical protein